MTGARGIFAGGIVGGVAVGRVGFAADVAAVVVWEVLPELAAVVVELGVPGAVLALGAFWVVERCEAAELPPC